jgi:protein O-GlcNAc transferase
MDTLQKAIEHHRAGRLQDAERLYRIVLQAQPNQPDANHNLGVIAVQVKKVASGLPYFQAALKSNKSEPQYWISYLDALIQLGQLEIARQIPIQAREQGFNEEVLLRLTSRLEGPSKEEISSLTELFNQKYFVECEKAAHILNEKYPLNGFGWKLLGAALQQQGRTTEALAFMQKAVELSPSDSKAHNNLGLILHELGLWSEAEMYLRQALTIAPDFAEAHSNLGILLKDQKKFKEAEVCLRRSIELKPDLAEAYGNLGVILNDRGSLVEALVNLRKALTIKPRFSNAYSNLGTVYRELGQLELAIENYRTAFTLDPQNMEAHSNLLYTMNHATHATPAECFEEVKRYREKVEKSVNTPLCWLGRRKSLRPLRVGFVSGDLFNHPVGYFLEGILTHIDPSRIELFAYPTMPRSDELTDRIRSTIVNWRPMFGKSDAAFFDQIITDEIDILIDLSGHTAFNRLPVFARKPAPLQVTWLGYFATTGLTTMDYLIADPWVLPEEEEKYFSENIWRLPQTRLCFTPPKFDIEVSSLPALKNGYITFGCFNNPSKINDLVVTQWARIMDSIPSSRLLLKGKQFIDDSFRETTISRFVSCGIDKSRLTLEGPESRAGYLAAYQNVDVSLDTFPYPGGTTTVEGLWMGVPVLTLSGTTLLSRQGLGLLQNVGLSNWIAADLEEYVALAIAHCEDFSKLGVLRKRLRQQVIESPICDSKNFAKNLENALEKMWLKPSVSLTSVNS